MYLLPTTYYLLPTRRAGQAVLSFVLLVGGIVAFVSITLALIVLSFINSSSGFIKANRAFWTASSGAEDAALRLLRNKDFLFGPPGYTVPVGQYSATVTVAQGSIPGQVEVTSRATVSFYNRNVRAVFAVVSSTGAMQLVSWGEVAL